MKKLYLNLFHQIIAVLLLLSTAAAMLLLVRYVVTDSMRFVFLLWNLLLAWVPVAAGYWFLRKRKLESPLTSVLLFLAWLLFLPNAFYIVTDFIHLRATGDINILFDIVLLFLFAVVGFLLGVTSLGSMHLWFRQYMSRKTALLAIYGVIFLCSFAIYLGRYLRWNSWSIVTNPFGLLIDVSDRVIAPLDNPRTISTTLVFFVLIGVVYGSVWWLARYLAANYKQLLKG